MNLPAAYTTAVSGRAREFETNLQRVHLGISALIIFMYMILASQFESTVHPLTILLRFAAVGSFRAARVCGQRGIH